MELIWDDALGYGFYPIARDADPYNRAYWEKYQAMDETEMGGLLNHFRCEFVRKHAHNVDWVIDIGIGAGAFINALDVWMPRTTVNGFDVNPEVVEWLKRRNRYYNPRHVGFGVIPLMTFWDSLEHIADPAFMLKRTNAAAISMPIYRDREHVMASKHFRPDEHYWYFTARGLIGWMKRQGFNLIADSARETELGREDIWTYFFRRTPMQD